jgi:regulatory protein
VRNKDELLRKAKEYAFFLLKFRLRSERELYGRLKKKSFEDEIARETVSFLKDKGFIDDSLFTKSWIEFRLKRPLGLRRIKQELNSKGIAGEIIDREINRIKASGYCEADIITELAKERLNKIKDAQPKDAKRRLYSYLLRRGFSPEIVMDAINELNVCKHIS